VATLVTALIVPPIFITDIWIRRHLDNRALKTQPLDKGEADAAQESERNAALEQKIVVLEERIHSQQEQIASLNAVNDVGRERIGILLAERDTQQKMTNDLQRECGSLQGKMDSHEAEMKTQQTRTEALLAENAI